MKRSEFISLMGLYMTPEGRGDLVAELERENGVKWDPEEPELPKRLRVHNDGTNIRLFPTDECYSPAMRPSSYYPAACDAYNRLQSGELVEKSKLLEVANERNVEFVEKNAVIRALHHIARSLGMPERITGNLADVQNLAHDIQEVISGRSDRPADVVSKTKGGKTIHYAVGPVRATREEAELDLGEWFGGGRP